jgi:hypothetical protein
MGPGAARRNSTVNSTAIETLGVYGRGVAPTTGVGRIWRGDQLGRRHDQGRGAHPDRHGWCPGRSCVFGTDHARATESPPHIGRVCGGRDERYALLSGIPAQPRTASAGDSRPSRPPTDGEGGSQHGSTRHHSTKPADRGSATLRYGLALNLLWIGRLKFEDYETDNIRPLIVSSPPFEVWPPGTVSGAWPGSLASPRSCSAL